MKIHYLALMGLSALAAFTSCKKEDDPKSNTTSTSESIVGTWKITALTHTMRYGGVDTTEDVFAQMDPCERDDLIQFDAAHNMFIGSGAIKCDPSEPDFVSQGTWALQNNNTSFLMFQGDTTVAQVETLNTTTFKFKITDVSDMDTIIVRMTLTK